MQNSSERRIDLIIYLCEVRHEIIDNLASMFNVERRTIRRDIEILSLSHPIYTTKGRGGGVHVMDGYRFGKRYMTEEQISLLEKLSIHLTGNDLSTMKQIIKTYKRPVCI